MRRDGLSVPTFSTFNKAASVPRKIPTCCCNGANSDEVHYLNVRKTISNRIVVSSLLK